MVPRPISPYAISKISAQNHVEAFNELYNLETVSLRYFNVYGPRQGLESRYNGVMTAFIDRLLNGQLPIIYGDGEQIRDFVHEDDAVSANMLALESKNAVGGVSDIDSGTAIIVYELVKVLQRITNVEHLRPIFTEPRAGDVENCFADISKA